LPADLLHAARARLANVPWAALGPLAAELSPALEAVLAGRAADRALDRFLRDHRTLDAPGRAATAEAFFGVGLWRRHLRALTSPDAPALVLLAALARDLGGFTDAANLLDVTLPAPRTLTDWRDLASVPDWLATELELVAGDAAPALAAALNVPAPVFLRANPRRYSREALAQLLAERGVTTTPTRWARDGLEVTSARPNLLGLGLDGAFEVQDEGSQLLTELVDAQPGDQVLDLCAGAGGKALGLASHVGPTGLVHCLDPDASRLDRLRVRASRADARVALHGASAPPSLKVARVLVDAPCSELGVLRRGPDLRWRMDPAAFAPLPALQLDLISRGVQHLQPGGTLVYATCTLRHAENQDVVAAALARHPTLQLVDASPEALTHDKYLLTRPDLHRLDGFFAAVLRARP
jgi:16S rRNA (cytosine967-C5)-methyltransferase